ncbi:glycosyltransferase family 4 protein [Pedobacter panaciterrae]
MGKKILIHSIVFSPDGVSTAYLYNDIALKFKASGYDVVVLTTTPHYNVLPEALKVQPLKKRLLGLYYESNFNGIKVKHVPQKKFSSALLRIIGFVYWHILSFFIGLFEKEVSVILSPSPPLTIGFINLLIGKIKKIKVVYNVQEIYPDFLIEQGGLKSKFIISLLKWLERFVYNHSDAVTTIDAVFYNTIADRFRDRKKLTIIPNFVDTALYRPLSTVEISVDSNFFPLNTSTLKLMYAGNIGHAQDWVPLIKAAIRLKDRPFEFFIIGEGVMKNYIQEEIKDNNLTNVHLVPYQPREQMASLIAYSDLQFIFMSPEMEGHGFPSKVYTIMACAKPLLVCSGESTPIYRLLKDLQCAYLISERDIEKKVTAIINVLDSIDKVELKKMGELGLDEVTLRYSNDVVTSQYVELINKIITNE